MRFINVEIRVIVINTDYVCGIYLLVTLTIRYVYIQASAVHVIPVG